MSDLAEMLASVKTQGYKEGKEDTFNLMQDSCRNGHQVQNPDDHKEWQQCCFLIETGEYDLDLWKCCYEHCPLMK